MTFKEFKLNDFEISLIDGKCTPENQAIIDGIKQIKIIQESGASEQIATMAIKILEQAREQGRLTFISTSVRYCPCCKKSAGYYRYTRNTRYHNKGEEDKNSPLLMKAYDLDRGFVICKNAIFTGFCDSCKDEILPIIRMLLKDIPAEIPEKILGFNSGYKKYSNKKCKSCGWEGHEGEMGFLPAIFEGQYRGSCPKCKAENMLFNTIIESRDGFTIVKEKNENI